MVSSLKFAYMHLRLDEVCDTNEWFGSDRKVWFNDLFQQSVKET